MQSATSGASQKPSSASLQGRLGEDARRLLGSEADDLASEYSAMHEDSSKDAKTREAALLFS
eukprot:CAMPEP_0168397938 /NCGR_PEP_ID=MMETSP0228-20121227/21323_1 /TAXON_ID=133427 /ORGANISM="Protoceratium reticulatum, Strain CCCM 535 (=CCMP 1889)" /LENGTH=61 /DNA_ID=CAMNT_0008411429 /DNA_START=63 /DNA_END=245 /DNA_ORIENTATION=+